MEELLQQIEQSSNQGMHLIGLYAALSLPDICAALQSENGESNGRKYKRWFDEWVSPKYNDFFTGEQCYAFRCGVVHQGRAQHGNLGYSRIIFVDPASSNTFHNNVINDAFNIDVACFCHDMTTSVRQWLDVNRENQIVQSNLDHLLQRRPGGLRPYIVGIDVFS